MSYFLIKICVICRYIITQILVSAFMLPNMHRYERTFLFMEVIVQKMIPGIIYFTESLLFQSTDVKNVTITEVTDK